MHVHLKVYLKNNTLRVRSRVVEQHSVATYRGPCRGHF